MPSARRWPSASPSARSPPASCPAREHALVVGERARHRVEVARQVRVRQPLLGRVQLGLEHGQLRPGGAHGGARVAPVAVDDLRQVREHEPAAADHGPVVGVVEPGDDAQQRGLAAAVGAEDADPRPGLHVEVGAAQDLASSERLGDTTDGEQRHAFSFDVARVRGNRASRTRLDEMPAPLINVGPEPEDHLVSAVEDGGGRVVALDEAEGVIWAGGPDFPQFPSGVRWVQLPAAGVESWMDAVQAQPRIQFTSCAGAYATQVAEHALALLLAGVRGIVGYARTKTWDPGGDHVLEGSTVAIVGAGGIGRELIKMLEPHDVQVIAVTRSGRDDTLPVERLGEVWGAADHFVIAAPATDGTRHLVGADELAQMKPHSWIVNIARGALIDADALVDGVAGGADRRRRAGRHRARAAPGRPPALERAARADHPARREPAGDDEPRPRQARHRERAPLRRGRGPARAY